MPASRNLGTGDASPGTAVHTGHGAPISVKIAGGMWCPQSTEPLQSEIGTPSVNTVGEYQHSANGVALKRANAASDNDIYIYILFVAFVLFLFFLPTKSHTGRGT